MENYQEWLTKYNFGKWILSDVDNFMRGNPLFLEGTGMSKYEEDIFKDTNRDPNISFDIKEIN